MFVGDIINCTNGEPIKVPLNFVSLAEFRTAGFSITSRHTEADAANIYRIMQLDAEEADGDFEKNRRELTVLPLTGILDQINNRYTNSLHMPSSAAEWNRRIDDFLNVVHEDFDNYLKGLKWSHKLKEWFQIDPPRPEQVALVAGDLARALNVLSKKPFSEKLTEENREMLQGAFDCLRPYLKVDFTPPSHDPK